MSRRKHLAVRTPCGKLRRPTQDTKLLSPTEVRRLVDAAASGLRDGTFGTLLGRLYLDGKVSATEYAAGKHWSDLTVNYSVVCRSPSPPTSVQFDRISGMPLDPDSEQGEQEVVRHEFVNARYLAGRNALRLAGATAERAVTDVCELGVLPVGLVEFNALRDGLQSLSKWLSDTRRKAHTR